MAKILEFDGITGLNLEPDKVLEEAKGCLESVLILGRDKDGDLFVASSSSDGAQALWDVEDFKYRMFNGDFA